MSLKLQYRSSQKNMQVENVFNNCIMKYIFVFKNKYGAKNALKVELHRKVGKQKPIIFKKQ